MVCGAVAGADRVRARSAGPPWPAGDPLTHAASNPEALMRAKHELVGRWDHHQVGSQGLNAAVASCASDPAAFDIAV